MVIMKEVKNGIERSIVVEKLFGTTKQIYMLVCNYGFGMLNIFPFNDVDEAYDSYLRMCGRKGA